MNKKKTKRKAYRKMNKERNRQTKINNRNKIEVKIEQTKLINKKGFN